MLTKTLVSHSHACSPYFFVGENLISGIPCYVLKQDCSTIQARLSDLHTSNELFSYYSNKMAVFIIIFNNHLYIYVCIGLSNIVIIFSRINKIDS